MISINELKKLRPTHSLRQQDMARIMGISQGAYSKTERGMLEVTLIGAFNITMEFDIDLNRFAYSVISRRQYLYNKKTGKFEVVG